MSWIEEEKSLVFSLKLAREESSLQKWIIERSAPTWAYISADTFSALSSKGKTIQLPWSEPSSGSGLFCNMKKPRLEDPDPGLDANSGGYLSFRLHQVDDLHF